jgi:hypothetical protein
MNIIHYCDPGHGWFKVSKQLLVKLGIERDISSYSYQRGDYVYLEEDCDADLLFLNLQVQGVIPNVVTKHTNKRSRIRGYGRYETIQAMNELR